MTDSNIVFRLYGDQMGNSHVDNFIGYRGALFYNPDVGDLRLGVENVEGGVSLFKALASNFGVSADGGSTIQNSFDVLSYNGGNASSPYDIYDNLDGNMSTSQASIDVTASYTFTNTLTFSNTVTVTGIKAGGTQGQVGQVLTSTGNGVAWANTSGGGGGGTIGVNTTLVYNAAAPSIPVDSSDATVSVGPGAPYSIPNFSGMLIVNDHFDGGVALYIAGGGTGVLVSNTTSEFAPTLTINNNGYDWYNTTNLTGPFTFTVIKTRNGS